MYGRGAKLFTAGEGRLARPKFSFSGNVSLGYDDNVFQTPTNPQVQPNRKVLVLRSLGSAATFMQVTVPSGDPLVPDTVRTVEIPAVPPKFGTETIPGAAPAKRIGSFVTRGSGRWEAQFASRRTLFTFDLELGADYYWNRPGKKSDPNDHVSLIYLRKLSGRAEFTIAVDASYQTQPNFSQPGTPTSSIGGSYLTANTKADLSYRLSSRFSTVTSVSYNSLYSQERARQNGDYNETIFGTELRYLFSPQLSLLGELRYSSLAHSNSSVNDTTSYILVGGGELTLSRRFSTSVRLGETLRTFTETSASSSEPYGEATLNYRAARGTTVELNARYGFEPSQGSSNGQAVTFRVGSTVTQVFSARLQGSLALNFVRTDTPSAPVAPSASSSSAITSSSSAGSTATSAASGGAASAPAASTALAQIQTTSTGEVQDTIDATLSFHYALSRHWGFNLSYSYTTQIGPTPVTEYYRQRVFVGGEYRF